MKHLTKQQRKEIANFLRDKMAEFVDHVTDGRTPERGRDWEEKRFWVWQEMDAMIKERLEDD